MDEIPLDNFFPPSEWPMDFFFFYVQVFGAIRQAVQLAPCYPESYNLNGLAFEAQLDYQSAVAAYRLAHLTISHFSDRVPRSHVRDISINLARSLCMVKFTKFLLDLYTCVYHET